MLTLAPAVDLVDTLKAANIRASLDPAQVRLPGVWVQVNSLTVDTYATGRVDMTLVLIVGDKDAQRAQTQLVDLFNQVAEVIPIRTGNARTILMPDGTKLPALAVPFSDSAPLT